MDLYPTLMNRGVLIFESDAKFVLRKIPTPADPRDLKGTIHRSYGEALDDAKVLIEWEEGVLNHQQADADWKMELMYRHTGLGAQFADLGEMASTSYEKAKAEAQRRGEAYIHQSSLEKHVVSFEVRVRPCRK